MKAPIALFCYNRPAELTQTINSIKRNKESAHSDIYIFSDGPKNSDDAKRVREVRDIIGAIEGFNTVNITFREQNIGLAENIIDGVNNVLSVHDRVIVIEDDLKVSNHFLCFMNEALERYKSASRVWHISGWNYPIDSDKLPDIFLWRVMNCWGWATWSNRWQHFNKDPQQVIDDFTHKDIYEFNVDGRQDFFGQIIDNSQGQINTWAIFWYATIFQNNGLCLNPAQTLVDNIGFSSGTHCNNKSFKDLLPVKPPSVWPEELKESDEHLLEIKKYFESVGPALPLELSSFNLTEAEISSLYPLLSRQNFSLRSSLEQIWYLMDSVWDNLELDNENLDLEKLQEFYMHPVWLLNGLYTETDNESIAHRKKLSNWVRSKPEIQKIVDVGGGIGFLARTIASDTPTSEIKILEPFPSSYAARVIENRKNKEFKNKI